MTTFTEISSPCKGEDQGGGARYFPEPPVMIARAKALRSNMTEAEKKLWYYLRVKNLGCKFRRQHTISNYIVDFVSIQKKIVIELDGGQHALSEEADARRDAFLHRRGYQVLRFWNHEVMTNIDGVLYVIHRAVQADGDPLPASPLQGEE